VKSSSDAQLSAGMTGAYTYRTQLSINDLEESGSSLYAKVAHVKQELK